MAFHSSRLLTFELVFVLVTTYLTIGVGAHTIEPVTFDENGQKQMTIEPVTVNEVRGSHIRPVRDVPVPSPEMMDSFVDMNPTHVKGEELFQGDILLTPEQKLALLERKAITADPLYRWPSVGGYPHVPYVFDANVDQVAVLAGIAHWEEHTCIRFAPATADELSEPHLRFIQSSGCYSYIGRIWFFQGQDLSIGIGCTSLNTVAHEIGHAMGFYHEQSRNDRDSYVVVNNDNILDGREGNFNKASGVSNFSIPYDFTSDMHYSAKAFTKDGSFTLVAKDPMNQELVGVRGNGLSHRDKHLANLMYPCIEMWLEICNLSSDPCLNEGYTGADCNCVCPPGTSGTICEVDIGDYYDAARVGCSEVITSETTITTPGYAGPYPSGLRCTKVIEAPECHTVSITVNDFEMYQQVDCSGTPCCYFEGLEIRTTNLNDGDWYCGTMIAPGTVFTSPTNKMILFYHTYFNNAFTGFSIDVEFVFDTACSTTTTTTTSTSTTSTSTTSTTTTSTSTSTSTTTTSTTPPAPPPQCLVSAYNGIYYWTSPGFGQQNYPDNFVCSIAASSSVPYLGVYTLQPLRLQSKVDGECVDYVTFTYPFGVEKTFCGTKEDKVVNLPYFHFTARFLTDDSINFEGFNISIDAVESPCHEMITLTSLGDTGTLKTPFHPNSDMIKHRKCEFWVIAPEGYKVQLEFLKFKVKGGCAKNNLVVNLDGDRTYPVESSTIHCGTTNPPTMTSTGTEADLVYQSKKKNKGFKVRYTVVA